MPHPRHRSIGLVAYQARPTTWPKPGPRPVVRFHTHRTMSPWHAVVSSSHPIPPPPRGRRPLGGLRRTGTGMEPSHDRADQVDPASAQAHPRQGHCRHVRRRVGGRDPLEPVWTARPWVDPEARAAVGKAARKRVPRTSHGTFEPAPGRDPIAILEAQEADRLPGPRATPPRAHGRVRRSPTTAARRRSWPFDLSSTPRTDIIVQASGDAHLSNFGLFASPERTLVFDANDFDETLPAPWEWDVKRLAASIVIAGRSNGFSAGQNRDVDDGDRPRLSPVDGSLRGDATPRRLVRLHHRRRHPGCGRGDRRAPGPAGGRPSRPARGHLRQGPTARRDARVRVADGDRRRTAGHPRRSAGHHARRDRRRPGGAREGLHGLSGHDGREPPRLPRAVSVRRLRAQGRRRRQRRDALLRRWSSRVATRTTRSSSRPRRRPHRCSSRTSRRAGTPTTASASWSASGSMQATPTSSSAGPADQAAATSTSASCGT